ncbi:DUF2335 domain-containing protein [Corynebacterium auriscanis]|uniref:DUF2335 domain-containing protein n=1 Tax=Corynebacterium auriscanis TaxID=99807 RepID=UPI0025B47265|nr:DUF2335 domain-containing protein [Corynebacterium auriscanis]WJY73238.1 hypothetical protein CAURIC_08125 [Corynebacterium auriscanis]
MENDHHQHAQSDPPRNEAGSGSNADGTSEFENDPQNQAGKPQQGDLDRLATDVQHTRREHSDDQEQPLEAELIPRDEVRQEVTRIMTSIWSGPTPSPETLKAFNEVDPSFAERAFKMSEETVATSNYERKKLVEGDVEAVKRGQWMAWTSSVLCVIGAVVCAVIGQPWVASVLLGPPIMQFGTSLVRTIRKDDSEKTSPTTEE